MTGQGPRDTEWMAVRPWYNHRIIEGYISSSKKDAHGDVVNINQLAKILPWLTEHGICNYYHTKFPLGKFLGYRIQNGMVKVRVGIHDTGHSNLLGHDIIWRDMCNLEKKTGKKPMFSIEGASNLRMGNGKEGAGSDIMDMGLWAVSYVDGDGANPDAVIDFINHTAKTGLTEAQLTRRVDQKTSEWVTKGRKYISNPSQAPKGAKVQRGKRGGFYYESTGRSSGQEGEDAQGAEPAPAISDKEKKAIVADYFNQEPVMTDREILGKLRENGFDPDEAAHYIQQRQALDGADVSGDIDPNEIETWTGSGAEPEQAAPGDEMPKGEPRSRHEPPAGAYGTGTGKGPSKAETRHETALKHIRESPMAQALGWVDDKGTLTDEGETMMQRYKSKLLEEAVKPHRESVERITRSMDELQGHLDSLRDSGLGDEDTAPVQEAIDRLSEAREKMWTQMEVKRRDGGAEESGPITRELAEGLKDYSSTHGGRSPAEDGEYGAQQDAQAEEGHRGIRDYARSHGGLSPAEDGMRSARQDNYDAEERKKERPKRKESAEEFHRGLATRRALASNMRDNYNKLLNLAHDDPSVPGLDKLIDDAGRALDAMQAEIEEYSNSSDTDYGEEGEKSASRGSGRVRGGEQISKAMESEARALIAGCNDLTDQLTKAISKRPKTEINVTKHTHTAARGSHREDKR